jgi:hypothetical protein
MLELATLTLAMYRSNSVFGSGRKSPQDDNRPSTSIAVHGGPTGSHGNATALHVGHSRWRKHPQSKPGGPRVSQHEREVIVVIGAGGIGEGIARRQAPGKPLVLADFNEDTRQSAGDALTTPGHSVTTRRVDVDSRGDRDEKGFQTNSKKT